MKLIVIVALGVLGLSNTTIAQEFSGKNASEPLMVNQINSKSETKLEKAEFSSEKNSKLEFDGTFQLFINNGLRPLLTSEIINFVEENRNSTEDVIVNYSEKIKVFILSEDSINSSDFQELELYKNL